ncbi:M61 family metallopeptidase [Olivibacter domesticus]|uniref:Predicted metalloprotease, contains C-terminal PDZ domain n=1 Tax=Olivibacter domesticus TaxID=407022 RepID=A0A1H7JD70_OLID1|nr:peptidase M61 [Olivibacter domesticus]SEK72402.1 Predicted metalloprotease, contains C-terminal PDZ domain [Olivibacter domesticus]
MKKTLLLLVSIFACIHFSFAQKYQYTVDLKNIQDDKLSVTLLTPKVTSKKVIFSLPKIIPGTYAISDYGNFITELVALNEKGKKLPVRQINVNQWEISKSKKLAKITYTVEDIFDTDKSHNIYPMAATNIEVNKNVVINSPGVFGYLEEKGKLPFEVTFSKPENFYASSSRIPTVTNTTTDVFHLSDLDDLYDTPIMYGVADTTSVKVGNCDVLISVYSPNQLIHAKEIAGWLTSLLQGAKKYLGGKLPTDRYAFLYYFKDPMEKQSFKPGLAGALEHTTSSFYYLPELPPDQLKSFIVDVSSHEFFHIITPLTIASKEVKAFNYNTPILSEHLWLYEGSTEYTAHHVQVKSGINTEQEFLDKLSKKIADAESKYNDTLAFTQLSKYAATTYAEQYGNVYQKGALIAACLDIYLLHLSDGGYGFKNLTHDLGVRFGKQRYFEDDQLFDEIEKLSYPEIKQFLVKYVQGTTPIPYDYYFGLAGIKYQASGERKLVPDSGAGKKALMVQKAWLKAD